MTGSKSEKQQAFEQQALAHTDGLYRFGAARRTGTIRGQTSAHGSSGF